MNLNVIVVVALIVALIIAVDYCDCYMECSKVGWRECKTSTGTIYYYNSFSKTIRWDKPDDAIVQNCVYVKVHHLSLFSLRKANIEDKYIEQLQVHSN